MTATHRFLFAVAALLACSMPSAQSVWSTGEQKIGDGEGGFAGELWDPERFGRAIATVGDLDGDGTVDMAVGAPFGNIGNKWRGAVWILFLHPDGTVKAEQRIGEGHGGFAGPIAPRSQFGLSLAGLGDLDRDGVPDLAVGSPDVTGGVWILFLRPDGTVARQQRIDAHEGGFTGGLSRGDHFGFSLACPGDLDGDGFVELAVGALGDDDGVNGAGAMWILFLARDGQVRHHRKLSDVSGGMDGLLHEGDAFGTSACAPGDIDGDGLVDLAVGAGFADNDRGVVWVLFLNADGTVRDHVEIGQGKGGFSWYLFHNHRFAWSVAAVGDLDGDGLHDLAVGDHLDDEGLVWILLLRADGTVRNERRLGANLGGFGGALGTNDRFGYGLAGLGDLDGDGDPELAVGAPGDDGQGTWDVDRGAVWVLDLRACPLAEAVPRNPDVGGHVNPDVLAADSLPVLGTTFTISVSTVSALGCEVVGYVAPLTLSTSEGNLLVDVHHPAGELLGLPRRLGSTVIHDVPIPNDAVLSGFTCSVQALLFGGALELTNALDVVVGGD